MKRAPKPIIEVRWMDANSVEGWSDPGEVEKEGPAPCCTVGYLLAETKDALNITGTMDTQGGRLHKVTGNIIIPKRMVVSRRLLRR